GGGAITVADATASSTRTVKITQTNGVVFTAAGDHGYTADSETTMNEVAGSGSAFYLALGDLSYNAGDERQWCETFKSKFNDVELLAGNHDVGESAGGDINLYRQACPFTLGKLTGDYGKQYYFDYPQTGPAMARFIMITPGIKGSLTIDYDSGGAGYTFTSNAIDTARAAGIKWIIVGMHKNCINAGTKSCEVGTDIMNLLITKRVDLVLQSHDHNYQRSHALSCLQVVVVKASCIADNGNDNAYVKGVGPVIVINGEFGKGFYDVNPTDSEVGYFAKLDSTTFGINKYTITDTTLRGTYLRSSGGSFADNFTIRAQ
ncbi:MAG TPA: metallophosphoesterase, partial [Candidatus Saccharimonadales bacterium]